MEVDTPRVSIIILNWNGWKDTIECLESLYRISYPNYDVIVIDNGSRDGSIESILNYAKGDLSVNSKFFKFSTNGKPIKTWKCTKEEADRGNQPGKDFTALPSNRRMTIVENDKNYGFAEGCNIGITYAFKALDPEYILLLNNDIVVHEDFLSELIAIARRDETIGFAGPMIYYYDFQGKSDVINAAGMRLNLWKGNHINDGLFEVDRGQYNRVKDVDYVEGSCMLVQSNALNEIGLLNAKYFAYWEETDLCRRGLRAGYRCVFVPKSKIWHKVSASSMNIAKVYYLTRNRIWFIRGNATRAQLAFFLGYYFSYQLWREIWFYVRCRDFKSLPSLFKGVVDGVLSAY
jgi:GT2 family glycosyltransferase